MDILKIILTVLYYGLELYLYVIFLWIILGWFRSIVYSKFYYILSKIIEPFTSLFSNKLIVGIIDLGTTLGLVAYEIILRILIYIINSI